jgi:hypothetical protein
LELVRYIHLNPIRAKIVKDIGILDTHPFSGHGVVMGKFRNEWQDVDGILELFGRRAGTARRNYRVFLQKGIPMGKRHDLSGGGLIRSSGGWAAIKAILNISIVLTRSSITPSVLILLEASLLFLLNVESVIALHL